VQLGGCINNRSDNLVFLHRSETLPKLCRLPNSNPLRLCAFA
jgi:hypothetical protein